MLCSKHTPYKGLHNPSQVDDLENRQEQGKQRTSSKQTRESRTREEDRAERKSRDKSRAKNYTPTGASLQAIGKRLH